MIITAIYATERTEKSTTYQLAQHVIKQLSGGDTGFEFHLPKAMPHYCSGCFRCMTADITKCAAYPALKPIIEAINASDLLIFTAPVYVYHVPGQMKALLDHFAHAWMVHRPNPLMFHKQALILSTAAGAGTKTAVRDIRDSLDYWGVGRVYTLRENVRAADWQGVSEKMRKRLWDKSDRLIEKIRTRKQGGVTPRVKVKYMFYGCRLLQKRFVLNPPDAVYWKEMGWLGKKRPWRS